MIFSDFSQYLQQLEGIPSRLGMTEQLAELYSKLSSDEVAIASYLMQGKLVPKYDSLEFQLSTKMVIRALVRVEKSGEKSSASQQQNLLGEDDNQEINKKITTEYKKLGDVGLISQQVVERSSKNNSKSELSIKQVHHQLVEIAKYSGTGSQDQKVNHLADLLAEIDSVSAKYVARIVIGKLRLGFSTMTMIDSLSWSVNGDKSESKLIEEAYNKRADVGQVGQIYLAQKNQVKRQQKLENLSAKVGIPIVPALCQRLNSSQEIIDKMGEVIAEPKYDGLRIQIHIDKSLKPNKTSDSSSSPSSSDLQTVQNPQIKAYTRSLDEVSYMFPELEKIVKQLNCKSCVLDAEAIGYDPKTDELLPFQQTMTRKRKHNVAEQSKSVPIRFYIFDILTLNGKSLIDTQLDERKKIQAKLFKNSPSLQQTPFITTTDAVELRDYHHLQLAEKLEGAVMKKIDSPYRSGRKGWSWVKIKEEEGSKGKLNDTLDLVVMGYYFGRGKRTEFGLGAILVGVLDSKAEEILTIAKIGTGLSDEQLKIMKKKADKLKTKYQPKQYQVNKMLIPDIWINPEIVVEVAADELTKSPNHTAGKALRFPRLIKFRKDKLVEEVTTLQELGSIKIKA